MWIFFIFLVYLAHFLQDVIKFKIRTLKVNAHTWAIFFPKNRFFFIFCYSVVHYIIRKIAHFKENLPSSSKVTALHYMAYVGFFTQLFGSALRQVKDSVTQFYI